MTIGLPDNGDATQTNAPAQVAESTVNRAQEHGWAPKTAYDYEAYTKSNKELIEAQSAFTGEDPEIAVGGLKPGMWHSDAAVYEWNDEFGDVGPRFEELEKQLFGAENHVRSGVNFSA